MEGPDCDVRPFKRPRLLTETDDVLNVIDAQPNKRELEVGINVFVTDDQSAFGGILKRRYTDFLVNEISLNGEVLHLKNLHAKRTGTRESPEAAISKAQSSATQPPDENAKDATNGTKELSLGVNNNITDERNTTTVSGPEPQNSTAQVIIPPWSRKEIISKLKQISEEERLKLVGYFKFDIVDQLVSLYKEIIENPQKKRRDLPVIQTDFTTDRTLRAEIHQAIRRIFQGRIDSQTRGDGNLTLSATVQKVQGPRNDNRQTQGRRGKLSWVDRGGEYLAFSLYKQNKDTMEVVSFLARQLKSTPKNFQFAGTKDRRAVTVQRVTAYRIEAERFAALNRTLRNAAVGDFEYQKDGLELGDLEGNEFVITLRDCQFADAEHLSGSDKINCIKQEASQRLQRLHKIGFLNFYGLQRFGTFAIRTDVVGVKLLKGDFEGACDSILEFSQTVLIEAQNTDSTAMISFDDKARAEAINIWKTSKKANDALDKLPKKFPAEISLIRHFSRHPQDFLGALLTIQRNLRLIYVHAYQSLIWNHAAGERWRLYGNRVVEGDLVLIKEHQDKGNDNEFLETVDADGEVIISASGDDGAVSADDVFERARVLTAEEALSEAYSMFDIVLPLPGFDIVYPSNAVGDFYKTIMSKDGLDPYDMRRKQKDFSLSGSYRKVLARIGAGHDIQVHQYQDDDQQFVTTDLDLINQSSEQTEEAGKAEDSENGQDEREKKELDKKIAAILKFQLGSSQYATIALREFSRGGVCPYAPEFGSGKGN